MTSKIIHPHRLNRRAVLTGAAAFGGMSLLPRRAGADQWPTRPVKLVVPFAAGGTTDILARVVAAKVSEEFGQQFIVENKTGAGGNIAAEFVAKAEPDGYTFVVGTPGTHAINQFVFKNMNYDQARDIAPVIIIARVPNLCSVTNSLPVKSVAELIAYAKSKPGELFYGTPGLGSTAHVSTELFKSMTGVEMTHVPYKGSAPALTDLIAGRVQLTIDNLPASQPFAESNSIRPLAVSSARRWPGLPDLPTIAEAGVPGYEAASWFTIGAPAKTSKEIIDRLNASVDKFLKTDDGIARLRKLGAEPAGGSPADMQAYVLAETEKWGKVAKFAGIKPE
ncbi:tripartite tricarboxylate transporter substrate binding protein [Bradyrhizobium sp. AUGA SZCCT0182]|uniref:Bug family tripartite tricarboxylate transporter substrate binding protein n=1 Tax=Bradyrhizobium sp. AUGA SZCCT0182 TaxID=2807667 RepID=UPI001BA9746E|nr:tripartite tricarboxylate transporter substrate binding protein [Bradyrhizobium sp. AUGA SZCCT0182]MBR1237307.1 tripartite tricarboxylate transporter substrate binding protein [Bradyrhizobium sp. AUGA SZCCT0182]